VTHSILLLSSAYFINDQRPVVGQLLLETPQFLLIACLNRLDLQEGWELLFGDIHL
jgi:hypothetical protein